MANLPPLTKQQVCDSQWNHSSSKMLYSFPKAIRFSPFKKSDRPDFYPLPSVRSTRAAGLGYGGRSDFTTGSKIDKPAFYPVKRDFDQGAELGPAYSFSASREAYSKVYIETNVHPDADNPGPGNYNVNKNNDGPAFSMGVRCPTDIDSRRDYPGPGTYKDPLTINKDGHYPLSTTINTKPVDFSMYKSKRFNYRYNNVPGPIYKVQPLFGSQIFNSKFKSSVSMSFGSRYNIHKADNTPGPGAYRVYSEFGDLPKIKRRKFKFRKKIEKEEEKQEEEKKDEKKEEGKEEIYMDEEEKDEVKPNDEVQNAGNVEENKQEEKKDDEKKEETVQENNDEKGENKEGENKEGENKEGENKEGENKEGENKEGENKEGENKEGENKEGENKNNELTEDKEEQDKENKKDEQQNNGEEIVGGFMDEDEKDGPKNDK